ncbi:hypothetical protein C8R43DRAFT_1127005 [Mycena crocata]|nr:hypothetical protein C8R43DRAFT_1127005 [Mycena crocata]
MRHIVRSNVLACSSCGSGTAPASQGFDWCHADQLVFFRAGRLCTASPLIRVLVSNRCIHAAGNRILKHRTPHRNRKVKWSKVFFFAADVDKFFSLLA